VIFILGALMGDVYASLALHDEHHFGLAPGQSDDLLLFIVAAYILFCPLVGRFCEGPVVVSKRVIAVGLAMGSAAYALMAVMESMACQAVGLFILGASEAMVLIPTFPVMLDIAGGGGEGVTGIVSSVLNTSHTAGECAGPWVSLALVHFLDFPSAMFIQALIMVGVFGVFVARALSHPQSSARESSDTELELRELLHFATDA